MSAYWGIAAHSAYDMFSWNKYLSVILVFFPSLGLWSGHVEKVSSARLIVLSAEGISVTGKSSSVLSGDLRFTWRLCPYDSSSLTNEKDHHYFLNSADVCW